MVRRKQGVIINIGSVSGLDNAAGNVAYGASKAALTCYSRTLAAEVGALGIRVNTLAPGLSDTAMASQMESKAGSNMISNSILQRLGSPLEVAAVVLFLASDDASFVTGETVRVDGGRRV